MSDYWFYSERGTVDVTDREGEQSGDGRRPAPLPLSLETRALLTTKEAQRNGSG